MTPLYSVATWDADLQAWTPQIGLDKTFNLTTAELKDAIRRLRELGYSCTRRGNAHEGGDAYVYIERTNGKAEAEILDDWSS